MSKACEVLNLIQALIIVSPDSKVITKMQYRQLLHHAHLGEKNLSNKDMLQFTDLRKKAELLFIARDS